MPHIVRMAALLLSVIASCPAQAQVSNGQEALEWYQAKVRANQREIILNEAADRTRPFAMEEWRGEPCPPSPLGLSFKGVRLPLGNMPLIGGKELYLGFSYRY